eukprot:6175836-Pleurochrysis_carterae.AAC.1
MLCQRRADERSAMSLLLHFMTARIINHQSFRLSQVSAEELYRAVGKLGLKARARVRSRAAFGPERRVETRLLTPCTAFSPIHLATPSNLGVYLVPVRNLRHSSAFCFAWASLAVNSARLCNNLTKWSYSLDEMEPQP